MIISLSFVILAQLSPTPAYRTIHQLGGDWQYHVTFRLSPSSPSPLTISPSDVTARISSPGLHNSRPGIPGQPAAHAHPVPATHAIAGHFHTSTVVLHGTPEQSDRCQERAILAIWADTPEVALAYGRRMPPVGPPMPPMKFAEPPGDDVPFAGATVMPGGYLNLRIRLIHQHEYHGIDPLLGRREVSLKIGDWTYRDVLATDREQYFHLPDRDWRAMAGMEKSHMDNEVYFSAPDCLVLDASEAGAQYHRLPERKVRGGVRMRLKFMYLVMPGCEGEPRVRVAQYRESPNQWRVLSDSGFERVLPKPVEGKASRKGVAGKPAEMGWKLFDEVFRTDPEANVVATDFRIASAELGLVWIDDIALDYIDVAGSGPKDTP